MKARKQKSETSSLSPNQRGKWEFYLYVVGQTGNSMFALTNLQRMCEDHLPGQFHIELIDLDKHPHVAKRDQIIIVPTLERRSPPPVRRIFGDLSNTERVLQGLELGAI